MGLCVFAKAGGGIRGLALVLLSGACRLRFLEAGSRRGRRDEDVVKGEGALGEQKYIKGSPMEFHIGSVPCESSSTVTS